MTQAYSKAICFHCWYRPLTPPCPATISVLSRMGRSSGCVVPVATRSAATHLAGSVKYTRVSLRLVVARIAGYACAVTFSYGL